MGPSVFATLLESSNAAAGAPAWGLLLANAVWIYAGSVEGIRRGFSRLLLAME